MTKQIQSKKSIGDLTRPGVQKQKALIAYGSMAVVITVLLGMISITNLNAYLPGFLVIVFQLLAFVGFGVLHVSLLKIYMSFPNKFPANNRFVFSTMVFLLVSLVLVLMYIINNSNILRMAFASSSAFLLPFIIMEVWQALNNFPEKEYSVWYNSDGVMDTRTTIFLNSVPVRLRLAMKYFDIEEETFELTVPGHTQFGKFFNQFIIEKNKSNLSNIECVDTENKPFGWQFYTGRLWGMYTQIIDPELSLIENKVSNNSIITAKRKRAALEPAKENLEAAEVKTLPLIKQNKSIKKHEAKK